MTIDSSHRPPPSPRRRLQVFLSGRIDGVSLDEASSWRVHATRRFADAQVDVYDPTKIMREVERFTPRPNEVFHNDRWNLSRSDVVLVNLSLPPTIESHRAPFFTIGEMFLAHAAHKPIICFGSPFVGRPGYEAIVTRSFETADQAVDYILAAYAR